MDFEAIAAGIVDRMTELIEADLNSKRPATTREQKIAIVLKHLRPLRAKIEAYENPPTYRSGAV